MWLQEEPVQHGRVELHQEHGTTWRIKEQGYRTSATSAEDRVGEPGHRVERRSTDQELAELMSRAFGVVN